MSLPPTHSCCRGWTWKCRLAAPVPPGPLAMLGFDLIQGPQCRRHGHGEAAGYLEATLLTPEVVVGVHEARMAAEAAAVLAACPMPTIRVARSPGQCLRRPPVQSACGRLTGNAVRSLSRVTSIDCARRKSVLPWERPAGVVHRAKPKDTTPAEAPLTRATTLSSPSGPTAGGSWMGDLARVQPPLPQRDAAVALQMVKEALGESALDESQVFQRGPGPLVPAKVLRQIERVLDEKALFARRTAGQLLDRRLRVSSALRATRGMSSRRRLLTWRTSAAAAPTSRLFCVAAARAARAKEQYRCHAPDTFMAVKPENCSHSSSAAGAALPVRELFWSAGYPRRPSVVGLALARPLPWRTDRFMPRTCSGFERVTPVTFLSVGRRVSLRERRSLRACAVRCAPTSFAVAGFAIRIERKSSTGPPMNTGAVHDEWERPRVWSRPGYIT